MNEPLNPEAPADLANAKEVMAELRSGYGDPLSGTAPYKNIMFVTLGNPRLDVEKDEICVYTEVHADHQSPYGDTFSSKRGFTLSLSDLRHLADTVPSGFRKDFSAAAKQLDAAVEKAKEARFAEILAAISPALTKDIPYKGPIKIPKSF